MFGVKLNVNTRRRNCHVRIFNSYRVIFVRTVNTVRTCQFNRNGAARSEIFAADFYSAGNFAYHKVFGGCYRVNEGVIRGSAVVLTESVFVAVIFIAADVAVVVVADQAADIVVAGDCAAD